MARRAPSSRLCPQQTSLIHPCTFSRWRGSGKPEAQPFLPRPCWSGWSRGGGWQRAQEAGADMARSSIADNTPQGGWSTEGPEHSRAVQLQRSWSPSHPDASRDPAGRSLLCLSFPVLVCYPGTAASCPRHNSWNLGMLGCHGG